MQRQELVELIEAAALVCGSNRELGKLLGVSGNRVTDWKTGQVTCPPEVVAAIAVLAGKPPTDWLCRAALWKSEGKTYEALVVKGLGKFGRATGAALAGFIVLGMADIPRCIDC
jgi:hypothetical protein